MLDPIASRSLLIFPGEAFLLAAATGGCGAEGGIDPLFLLFLFPLAFLVFPNANSILDANIVCG